ncbi:MAG TPA: HAD-IIB family hydrolase [Spirochaetota bacterium]|nr:HAD-IIB family hydrolase [Spirochaetota bacterium]HOS33884.1 HAD-IIB family hydrolase [Spirochaetota bacterium]HOS33893.1 HAD-IIB family hydrolase [Spirochaetota bacterium]HOS56863.1 HAD-IIB family hydrolase [Spirochaetota bacterium]HPK62193.1 HAD-IIB family hydrolase [Spirochaetota bacterium]
MEIVKLISFDLDGTLLNDYGDISDFSKKKIFSFADRGIITSINTGRGLMGMRKYLDQLPVTYSAANNGALVYNNLEDRVEVIHFIENEHKINIVDYVLEKDLTVNIFFENRVVINKYSEFYYGKLYQKMLNPVIEPKLTGTEEAFSIDVEISDINLIDTVVSDIEKYFGKYVAITHSGSNFFQINKNNITKGTALSYIADKLSIPLNNTLSIGDSANDYPLLETSGIALAMINGEERLKSIAHRITKEDNNNNGAVNLIESILSERGNEARYE